METSTVSAVQLALHIFALLQVKLAFQFPD
jgi:hypothetical protein